MDTEVIKDSENMSSTLKMPFTPKSFLKKKLKTEKLFLDVTTWKEMEERIHPKRRVLVSNLLHDREAGTYLGNSEAVNNQHYTPVNLEAMSAKLRLNGPEMILPQIAA